MVHLKNYGAFAVRTLAITRQEIMIRRRKFIQNAVGSALALAAIGYRIQRFLKYLKVLPLFITAAPPITHSFCAE